MTGSWLCLSDLPNPALSLWSNICYPSWSICQITSAASRCGYVPEYAAQVYKLQLRIGMHNFVKLCQSTNHSLEHLLLYLSNGNVVHGLIVLEVKCPAVQDILLLLIYQISFLHEAGWVFAAQRWPCPLLSMPVTTLHYTKVVLWLCCLDWAKPPHECITI